MQICMIGGDWLGALNVKTSIDMVRVTFSADPETVALEVQKHWDRFSTQGTHVESFGYYSYRHLWTFPAGLSSVSILFGLNSDKQEGKKLGAIEWNPNKVVLGDSDVWPLVKQLLMFCKCFTLSRFDFACDLVGVRMSQCLLERGNKASLQYFMGSTDAMTIYAGKQGSAGYVKVYDKQREMIEKGLADPGIMTRYETSLKCDYSFLRMGGKTDFCGSLKACTVPTLTILGEIGLGDEIDTPMQLILEGLRHAQHLFNLLSYRQRQKVKALQCCTTVTPDLTVADELASSWYRRFYNDIIA